MKIWILTTEYPPFYGGGIATYCWHTAQMLADYGHHVTIIVNDDTVETTYIIDTDEKNKNIRVVRFKPGQNNIFQYLGYIAGLSLGFAEAMESLIVQEGKPDIIECQEFLGIGYFLLQRKKVLWPAFKDIPVLVTMHTSGFLCDTINQAPVYRFPNFWIGEMERFVLRAADGIISPSQFSLSNIKQYVDLSQKDCSVIHNPYPMQPLPINPAHDEKTPAFLFVGRLQYIKGVVHLLRYFRELWEEGLNIRLQLIGADSYFHSRGKMMGEFLKTEFSKYFEQELVSHKDKIPPDQLHQEMHSARAVILPSLFETFPYVVIESMSQAKVVLASSNGGQAEIIDDGKNGFIFSHENMDSFKEKIHAILDLPPERAQQMGVTAQESVKKMCSYSTIYEQKLCVLEKLIQSQSQSRIFPFIRDIEKKTPAHHSDTTMLSKNTLSVVIPYYNMGEYLNETLECLSRISLKPNEIIIVNDCSTDLKSIAVLNQIKKIDSIQIIHQERNLGLPEARNRGARHAQSEFLAFLDADDLISSEYYEWAIRILNAYDNVSFVGSWVEYFGNTHGIWPAWNPEFPLLLLSNMVNSSGLVVRRRDFLRTGLNDPKLALGLEDYDMVINMVKHGCRGVVIPKPLFNYRVRTNSITRQLNRDNQVYLYRLLTGKHRDLYSAYASEVFNLLYENGPTYLYNNPTLTYPPIGFIKTTELLSQTQAVMTDPQEIPSELRAKLVALWKKPLFRKAIQLALRLKLDKFFARA